MENQALADIFVRACELEVLAFKPGNVSVESPGYGMTAEDFLRSARAAALPLVLPQYCVGERVFHGIAATQQAVATNTNLGIVLLAAPLLQAGQSGPDLAAELVQVLSDLTIEDARLVYRAIRLARPGGLGAVSRHDVTAEPMVTLLVAMQEAAAWDGIAKQYATGYRDVFDLGAARFQEALHDGADEVFATMATFIALLAALPDTLIARKHGEAVAQRVSQRAAVLNVKMGQLTRPEPILPELREWDRELKSLGLNPGTTADLTVASILVVWLDDLLQRPRPARGSTE